MTMANNVQSIAAAIVSECQDDFVGLWAIHWEVKRAFPEYDTTQSRSATIDIVRRALESGKVVLGDFDGQKRFGRWNVSHEDALERILARWAKLQHEPDIGDLGWLAPADFRSRS